MNIEDLRTDFTKGELKDSSVDSDPILQFKKWFEFALESGISEPNAMTLATSTPEGKPSARIVLLKGFDESGFTFFTNYEGRKGRELAGNPFAALVIYWKELERQVRIEGRVKKVNQKESDKYFYARSLESRISAVISRQSKVVESRRIMEDRWVAFLTDNFDKSFPRPENWGGYILEPKNIEFWQGRPNRLHDRILFTKKKYTWKSERLEP
ncbi:MAG: pyridoxamine 5'-phosphate oxidase [Bacteroidales bacterium]